MHINKGSAVFRLCFAPIFSFLKFMTVTVGLLLATTLAHGGSLMGFLTKDTGVVFSDFTGQILYEGKPAAGAKLRRTYELFGKKGEDSTVTNEHGRFEFDAVIWKYREPLLTPTGFLVHQQIFVDFNGESIQIWSGSKRTPSEYYEFNGQPENFYCELTEKEIRRVDTGSRGFVGTTCHWGN